MTLLVRTLMLSCLLAGCRAAIAVPCTNTTHRPAPPQAPAPTVQEMPPVASASLPTAAPVAAVALTPEIRAARDHAQRRVLRPIESLLPDLPAPGAAQVGDLPGFSVSLEKPEGVDALAHFHMALEHLATYDATRADAEPPTKLRIAAYGASGTTEDVWTAYLRAYLQARFGDGGPGVVAAAPHARYYHHNELRVTATKGWLQSNPQRKPLDDSSAYGLMLVTMRGLPRAAAPVSTSIAPAAARMEDLRVAHYEVWSNTRATGGAFSVAIDGAPQTMISTKASAEGARYDVFDVEPGPHTLSLALRGDGEVRLFGVVAESDRPGIVLDTLGFVGARGSALLKNDETLWAEQMTRRNYDLYLLAYGTNEGFDDREKPIDARAYEAEFSELLARFARAAPEASCVVMLPALHDAVPEGDLSPAPRIATIRPIMRRLALARGCATFDGETLLGAPDGMRAWLEAGLARKDLVHLTARGGVRFGMAVGDALMEAWDRRPASP